MWRKGNRRTLYSSLWPIWRSKRKTNSRHVFIVWLNAPQSRDAPYSRSRWRNFTNGKGTDSTSSRLYTGNRTLRFIIYLLFSTVIILFIFISVSTYQYVWNIPRTSWTWWSQMEMAFYGIKMCAFGITLFRKKCIVRGMTQGLESLS
jgi:hypothetical protein